MADQSELAAPPSSVEPQFCCKNCQYVYLPAENSTQGWCRRFPPSVFQSEVDIKRDDNGMLVNARQTLSQYPLTHSLSWCGEHRKIKSAK